MKRFLLAIAVSLTIFEVPRASRADAPPDAVAVEALRAELQRSMRELAIPGMAKPYFIAYTLSEARVAYARATFGALVHQQAQRNRHLIVEVRVGDPTLDNTNYASGFDFLERPNSLPLNDDPAVLRHEAWIATDRAYKKALDLLEKKKAHQKAQSAASDEAGSFSKEPVVVNETAVPASGPDEASFAPLVRKVSSVFREFPAVQSDAVSLMSMGGWTAFLSTEGASITSADTQVVLDVTCTAQADDGMTFHRDLEFRARDLGGLPSEATLLADVRRAADELGHVRTAPMVEDATAPVLFEGIAAPEMVRDLLAVDLSGTPHEQREGMGQVQSGDEGGLRSRLGQRILPRGFRVVDDPTIDVLGTVPLFGGYKFDDEGVPAQKVLVVDDGVLKTLLMSRAPIKEIPHSNGHGLRSAYGASMARGQVANLVVTAANGLDPAALRKKLLAEMQAAGAQHGYIVRAFAGHGDPYDAGEMSRGGGSRPLALVEVDKEGKERLVRGGSLESLALRSLKDIVAAGKEPSVWSAAWLPRGHGSGGLGGGPVSIAAPALLFKDVEIKKHVGQEPKVPVLTHPFFEKTQ